MRDAFDRAAVSAFLIARHGPVFSDSDVEIRPLEGGLCAAVALVSARLCGGRGPRSVAFMAKLVHGVTAREAVVYRRLSRSVARRFSLEHLSR